MTRHAKTGKQKKVARAEPAEFGALIKQGWMLYAHPTILDQIDKLERRVRNEAKPNGDAAKVLKWLARAIFDEIPQDPTLAVYRQGDTLGKGKTHWFRDKYAGRFRLFFRYNSAAKIIVYGWVNDEETLREYDSKTDAYAVFKAMLDNGRPPNDWSSLLEEASAPAAVKRLKRRV
jgi:toxin YhaV